MVIALARYGGLRWSDILWDEDRFVVRSPKTEHFGKGSRIVPIFPELRPYLLEAAEQRPEGQEKVFRDIDKNSNLRTETERILERCGFPDGIPRFYQNCRSSRQTELETAFPIHVVCKWLGNTEGTARKYYLKVQEKHFEAAASAGMHQSMQLPAARCGKPSQASARKQRKTLGKANSRASTLCADYTRQDSDSGESAGETDDSAIGYASGYTLSGGWPEVRQVIAAGEDLPTEARQSLIELSDDAVRESEARAGGRNRNGWGDKSWRPDGRGTPIRRRTKFRRIDPPG